MADEPVKNRHRLPDVDEREMARYRSRLEASLAAERTPRRPIPLWAPLAAAVGVIAAAFLLLGPDPGLPKRDLEEIRALAGEASPRLLALARTLTEEGEGLDRWNATMILCLTEPPGSAVRYAARGLQEDPRAEFRFFYLEYLLDNADGYRYNPDLLEALMDRETDSRCLRLYGRLHRLAV
jgi:hypothetical protein